MDDIGIMELVFYGLMIVFGVFLPVLSILIVGFLEMDYSYLSVTLAMLPGFFVGLFLVLYSLARLWKEIL